MEFAITGVLITLCIFIIASRMGGSERLQLRQSYSLDQLPPEKRDKIKALALSGQKIAAIQELRAATQLGLREAKDAVEAINRGPVS